MVRNRRAQIPGVDKLFRRLVRAARRVGSRVRHTTHADVPAHQIVRQANSCHVALDAHPARRMLFRQPVYLEVSLAQNLGPNRNSMPGDGLIVQHAHVLHARPNRDAVVRRCRSQLYATITLCRLPRIDRLDTPGVDLLFISVSHLVSHRANLRSQGRSYYRKVLLFRIPCVLRSSSSKPHGSQAHDESNHLVLKLMVSLREPPSRSSGEYRRASKTHAGRRRGRPATGRPLV